MIMIWISNSDKTRTMLICFKRLKFFWSRIKYQIWRWTKNSVVRNQKLLDIHIDKSLLRGNQINKLCAVIVSRLHLMSRLKAYLPIRAVKLYYNGYIPSVRNFFCFVWRNASKNYIEKLYKLQKRKTRIILNVGFDISSLIMF